MTDYFRMQELGLSIRARKGLARLTAAIGLASIDELKPEHIRQDDQGRLRYPDGRRVQNCGQKTVAEIRSKLFPEMVETPIEAYEWV